MGKIIIFGFILLLFSAIIYAQSPNCQYKDTQDSIVEEERFYWNGTLLSEKPTIEETVTVDYTHVNFKVYNPYNFSIMAHIYYETFSKWYGDGTGGGTEYIGAKEYHTFKFQHNTGASSIGNVVLSVIEPEGFTQKLEKVTKQKVICKSCGSKDCLDDNYPCSQNFECGSGICSIAGYCDKTKIVPCPLPKRNCNDQYCLTPGIKSEGESYYCDWECKPSLTNLAKNNICGDNTCLLGYENCKNRTCAKLDSRKTGEEYLCKWECESGLITLSNKTCGYSFIYYVLTIILVTIVIIIIVKFTKIRRSKR